jgi:hypothetical protein
MPEHPLSFHFTKDYGNIDIIELYHDVFIQIESINNEIAIISFMNEKNENIDIPKGVKVNNITHAHKELVKPINNVYALSWFDNYCIYYNGKSIKFINKRNWDIFTEYKNVI